MDFCSLEGLRTRFGERLLLLLTDDNGLGVIDETKTTAAIRGIQGEAEGFLRDGYALPLSELPPELQTAAEDMVLERIYSNKPERETPKDVKDRAAAARSWLEKVKKGVATLSVATLSPAAGSGTESGGRFFRTNKTRGDRIFTDDKLDGFTG